GHAIDDDERAGGAVAAIAVKANRLAQRDGAAADFVELQRRGVLAMERIDVDLIAKRTDRAGRELGGLLEPVRFAGNHWLFGHPDDGGFEFLLDARQIAGADEHIAAADVDFVFERERDRLWRERFFQIAVVGDNRLHAARFSRGQGHDLVAAADDPRGERAGEAAEVEV